MDRGLSTSTRIDDEGLRERNVTSQSTSTLSPEALTATGDVELKDKTGKDCKTFGRTPDGTGTCFSSSRIKAYFMHWLYISKEYV